MSMDELIEVAGVTLTTVRYGLMLIAVTLGLVLTIDLIGGLL